jgi:hypothetical protein
LEHHHEGPAADSNARSLSPGSEILKNVGAVMRQADHIEIATFVEKNPKRWRYTCQNCLGTVVEEHVHCHLLIEYENTSFPKNKK